MRARWLSRRALFLHLALLVAVPGCLFAGWWQVTRALSGNPLSYLYSVEWPVLAIIALIVWWLLVHTDPDKVGARAQRRMLERAQEEGLPEAQHAIRRREEEDPELAAYNDRLAELTASGQAKTWRRP